MQVDGEVVGVFTVVGGALVGWIVSVERRLALISEVRRSVGRIERRVELVTGRLIGREALEELKDSERLDGSGRRFYEKEK